MVARAFGGIIGVKELIDGRLKAAGSMSGILKDGKGGE